MIFESFSRPKARDYSVPPDDVTLHVPGRMTGVFDGASDSLGRRIGGVPIGRLAASTAARAAAQLPTEAAHWPATDILNHLSAAVGEYTETTPDNGPASTTALIAFEGSDSMRLVGIGDTGYRINGGKTCIDELAPDHVTIPARVQLFQHFQKLGETPMSCEALSQLCIGSGFLDATANGTLSQSTASQIIGRALEAISSAQVAEEVEQLLNNGLKAQFHFANAPDRHLGYGVLNGHVTDPSHAIDVTIPYAGLTSIEIFSDGYLRPPEDVSIHAWEEIHARIEREDPHKISQTLAVKGSTKTQFFDDRTVAIMRFPDDSNDHE